MQQEVGRDYTRADGLSILEVLSLGAGRTAPMWIGYRYGGGMTGIHPTARGVAVDKSIQRPGTDGLVYFLEFDASGRLWVGTERGVDVWTAPTGVTSTPGERVGVGRLQPERVCRRADGTVWIGTSGGLSRFKPLPQIASETPIDVVFTNL